MVQQKDLNWWKMLDKIQGGTNWSQINFTWKFG